MSKYRRGFRVAWLAASLPVLACASAIAAREAGVDVAAAGIPPFVLQDFGGISRATLETNALPYKVVATALLIREEKARSVALGRADLPAIYRQFGFVYPRYVGNWPVADSQPRFDRPLGMVGHTVSGPLPVIRIDAVTLGCATCHAGLKYGANGRATDTAWVGLPNTSINLEGYTQAVYEALKLAVADGDSFRGRVREVFPEISNTERFTLRYFLMPKVAGRLREYAAAGDVPLPFSNGGPGRTNGVASLKHMIGAPPGIVSGHADVGFTSIPDLSSRSLRSSLLYDGIYAPIGAARFEPRSAGSADSTHVSALTEIVSFFTVSTMGVTPNEGEKAIDAIRPSVNWIATRYQSPPFPGAIDTARARAGEAVYANRCSRCHGIYADGTPRRLAAFPNQLVTQDQMGTDSSRWAMIDTMITTRLAANAYGRHMTAERTGGYVAPILSGLWASAPYLHNGSVPTLWQLLTPDERPTQFMVGGHALDFTDMGIAGSRDANGVYRYDPAYVPWSTPELYDTRKPGLSNRGHDRQVSGLTDTQKRTLIEYLKTL
ncbi:hypothetical protein BH09GEM1_BH09GEM1_36820 [soil metagenome]